MNKKTFSRILLFLSLSLVAILFLILIILFVYWISRPSKNSFRKKYQYLHFDPSKNETIMGLVSLPPNFDPRSVNQVSSSSHNSLTLLSEIGANQFKCRGTCHCLPDPVNRRKMSGVVTLAIYCLVTALSTSVAVQLATNLFKDDCVSELSSTCSSDDGNNVSVKAEVERCEEVHDDGENEEKELLCEGNCKMNNRLKREDAIEIAKNSECQVREFSKNKVLDCSEMTWVECVKIAKKMFMKEDLGTFCKKNSIYKYDYICSKTGQPNKGRSHLCVGDKDSISCTGST